MSNNERNLATNSKPNQPIVCWNWYLKSLNGDKLLENEIFQKYLDLRYGLAKEVEFPEEIVVKYSIFQKENKDHKNKEFFLKKLVNIPLSISKKKKLLTDFFHQISDNIDETIEAVINHTIKYDVFEATAKSGKKYYLFDELRIIELVDADPNFVLDFILPDVELDDERDI